MNKIKEIIRLIILFIIGGCIYMGMETCFRGFTHWTMGIIGGLCFIVIGGLNQYTTKTLNFINQCLIGAIIITALEFVSGVILNIEMGLHIWDYSDMPFNLWGQVCLQFSLLWILLSAVAIILDDFIRWLLFNQKPPFITSK